MAPDATTLYYVGSPLYTIYAIPQQTFSANPNPPPTALVNSGAIVASISSDGTNLYYGTQPAGTAAATISYVPVGGGTPKVLYTSRNTNGSIENSVVAVGGAIYWQDVNTNPCPTGGECDYTGVIMGIAAP